MDNDKKVFAFKLAAKKETKEKDATTRWKAREGVSVAGCTGPVDYENYRESIDIYGNYRGTDKGYYC